VIPLLPYRKFDLLSPHPPQEVVAALSRQVEPRRWIRFQANRRFEGTVNATTFDVSRIISYRNSFVPQIHGTIAPEGNGSRISISMQLHVVVLAFLLVWVTLVCTIGGVFAVSSIRNGGPAEEALIPLGMFVFVWAMTVGGFWYEAWKAERLLCSITDGSRESRASPATPPSAPE
jgi:hypothetical protein